MKWMNTPTKLLGIYISYDKKGNNQMNFNLKSTKTADKFRHLEIERINTLWKSTDN